MTSSHSVWRGILAVANHPARKGIAYPSKSQIANLENKKRDRVQLWSRENAALCVVRNNYGYDAWQGTGVGQSGTHESGSHSPLS